MIDVCLLGPSGMMPMPDRWLSVLAVRSNGKIVMIDCGEATQIPLKALGWSFNAIESLLLTHYHADHVAGLPGLLLTLGNLGFRTRPLHIYGPPGLLVVVQSLMVIAAVHRYDVILHELPADRPCHFETAGFEASSLPMDHGTPCLAYSLYLPRRPRFDAQRARELKVPLEQWSILQNGGSVELDGRTVAPREVLGAERRGIKITYCTDSRPVPGLAAWACNSDLMVCEGMYGDDAMQGKAYERGHMTMREAAEMAREAGAGTLWLTHFSPSVSDPSHYQEAIRRIFPNTHMGRNLMTATLHFPADE